MKKLFILVAMVGLCFSYAFAEEVKAVSFEEKHQDKECIFLEYSEIYKVNEDWSYRREDYNFNYDARICYRKTGGENSRPD